MSTLTKPIKTVTHTRVLISALKPADAVRRDPDNPDDPTRDYYVRFINRNAKEESHKCTARLFKKVHGKRRKHDSHTGLDWKTETGFILHRLATGNKEFDLIDQFPEKLFVHKLLPSDNAEKKNIVLTVDDLGQITVESIPYKVQPNRLIRLLGAIDAVAELKSGELVADTLFEVVEIQGRRVTLSYTGEDLGARESEPDTGKTHAGF